MKTTLGVRLALALTVGAVAGCAGIRPAPAPPSYYIPIGAELDKADPGMPPAPGWRERIEAFTRERLKDPESARFKFPEEPRKAFISNGPRPENVRYFWQVRVLVNARNSYGGYTGDEPWLFEFRDGTLVDGRPAR